MMDTLLGYIDLNRRFCKLDASQRSENPALRSYLFRTKRSDSILGWPELLENRAVVVLGEPGSGKSWELQHQCSQIQSKDRYAVFVELERLISSDLREVLSNDDQLILRKWKTGDGTCHFFLDSVDESKIRRHADFYAALDKVLNAVKGPEIERARFVISSRISEWSPVTDRQEVLSRFGGVEANSGESPSETQPVLLVVQIEPLDREQVRTFVERKDIANSDSFIAALDKHSAWDFARRPIDVVDLVEFWARNGRLGTLAEVIENDVRLKLRETTRRLKQYTLSQVKARRGADCLAAATIFCKQQQFKVPDDAYIAPHALDAVACLPPDWSQSDAIALLTRAIFDSASYGQIRFHHRRVAEYLAASWLTERMSQGCPVRALDQLLIADINGVRTLRQSLAPLAAWLSIGTERWNSDVRDWILNTAPEIHFEFGDPTTLDIAYKRKLLNSWVARYGERRHVWVRSSPESMRRLSDPKLAPDISEYLLNSEISVDVRVELTEIVRHGNLSDCLPALVKVATSSIAPDRLRQYALIAIRDIGTPESRQQVWGAYSQFSSLSPTVCDLLAQVLYPGTIGAAELTNLIRRVYDDSSQLHHLQWSLESHLDEVMPINHAEELLSGLNSLVGEVPHIYVGNKESRVSQRYRWVLDLMPAVLIKLLALPCLTPSQLSIAADALSLLGEARYFPDRYSRKWEGLNSATLSHPGLRQRCFWKNVERARSMYPGKELQPYHVFDHDSVLDLGPCDFAWALRDVENSTNEQDQELALRFALGLKTLKHRSVSEARQLRELVRDKPHLYAILRDSNSSQRWFWFYRTRYLITSGRLWQQWKYQYGYRLENVWNLLSEQRMLFFRLGALRSGSDDRLLGYLCSEASEENEHRWAVKDWKRLEEKRGKWIARAAKEGCKQVWRRYTPLLPHEKPTPNETDRRVIVGLSGIQASITDGEISSNSLEETEVELATRYAANELNGFPSWLFDLAKTQPQAVAKVLAACVDGEWEYPATRQQTHDVLERLASEGGLLASLARHTVVARLRSGDPPNRAILDYAISLLLKTLRLPDSEIVEISSIRCQTLLLDAPSFALWAAVGMQLAADQTISIIEERFGKDAASPEVFVHICSLLGGGRRERLKLITQPDFLQLKFLRRLIPLVYEHVRPEDDINRSGGGPYSPTWRDEAQEFRSSLLSRVAESEEETATQVLIELLADGRLSHHHDWIRHLIDDRLGKDAERMPWVPNDIRTFTNEYETSPKTDRDLFQIVFNRISDIKHDVENSDNSLREELHEDADESALRRFLARKLQERSRQRYTIPQETEIDQKQRPDLRAENPSTAPVSIEIKLAHKWSIPELTSGLEDQLVGQYLRAHNSRCGIYVLGIHGRERHWKGEGGDRLDFTALCNLIELRASELTRTRRDFEYIKVIGIDFRSPT